MLHFDPNEYYGTESASFTFDQLVEWSQQTENATVYCKDKSVEAELSSESSRFSIDLNARVLLAGDTFVQTLIDSGVGRYFECTTIESTFVMCEGVNDEQALSVWEIPCSKTDIFKTKLLDVREKRLLMKFLQFVADYGEQQIKGENVLTKNERDLATGRSLKRPQNKSISINATDLNDTDSFVRLLQDTFKLSPKLQQMVMYAVALVGTDHVTSQDGLQAVYTYVSSIGRFAPTAYLFPLYGVSEISQSFCRLSAVYGGTFLLRTAIDQLKPQVNVGLETPNGRVLSSRWIVSNPKYFTEFTTRQGTRIFRKICIVSKSFETLNRLLLVIPPNTRGIDNSNPIYLLQLDSNANVCPIGKYLWHLSTTGASKESLNRIVEKLVQDPEQLLWSIEFETYCYQRKEETPSTLLFSTLSDPSLSIHMNQQVARAREIFEQICPSEPFLPRVEQTTLQDVDEEDSIVLNAAEDAIKARHHEKS